MRVTLRMPKLKRKKMSQITNTTTKRMVQRNTKTTSANRRTPSGPDTAREPPDSRNKQPLWELKKPSEDQISQHLGSLKRAYAVIKE